MGSAIGNALVPEDQKIYYNCPRCNHRVWALGPYVGTVCNRCTGRFGEREILPGSKD